VFRIVEKGGDIDKPLVEFGAFSKAAKWLVQCGSLVGSEFEIWCVLRFKKKKDEVWLEAEYEVLP
jgi:hypothetical protein